MQPVLASYMVRRPRALFWDFKAAVTCRGARPTSPPLPWLRAPVRADPRSWLEWTNDIVEWCAAGCSDLCGPARDEGDKWSWVSGFGRLVLGLEALLYGLVCAKCWNFSSQFQRVNLTGTTSRALGSAPAGMGRGRTLPIIQYYKIQIL